MNRNPGYRHLLLGAVCVLALSATMPIACAGQEDAPLGPPDEGQSDASTKKDTGPDGSKGGASGGGGSATGGTSGKGGTSGSAGKGGGTGGKGGGTGGKGGTSGTGGSGNSSGSSGSSGAPAYAVPAEGEPSCAAGQVFIFGTCFP